MKDEDLLHLAGDALRSPDALDDPRWDALAAGELDAEGRAELERLIAEADADDLPPGEALAAFEPLDDGTTERFEQLFETHGASPAGEAAVIPLARPSRWRWIGLAAPLLGAAAVLFLVFRMVTPPEPLPAWQLELAGGEQVLRGEGADADVPAFAPGTRFELVLRPVTRVDEPLSLRAWLVGEGTPQRLSLSPRAVDGGAQIVEGPAGELLSAGPGRYELVIVLTRASEAGSLPSDPPAAGRRRPAGAQWVVFRRPLELVAR